EAKFLEWEHIMFRSKDENARMEASKALLGYLREMIAERRRMPTSDTISYVATAKIDGQLLTDKEMAGICMILYSAGLESVPSMLGFLFKHLAEHPADQQRLRDNPEEIPHALEELLRAYPISAPARVVKRDMEFHGVKFKAGDRITAYTVGA